MNVIIKDAEIYKMIKKHFHYKFDQKLFSSEQIKYMLNLEYM